MAQQQTQENSLVAVPGLASCTYYNVNNPKIQLKKFVIHRSKYATIKVLQVELKIPPSPENGKTRKALFCVFSHTH